MKNKFVIIFAGVILTACIDNNPGIKDQNIQKSTFENFIDSLPILDLPFQLSTEDEMKHFDMTSSHKPEGAALIGKLPSLENLHLIIYSYPADIRLPILEVYDNNGKKVNDIQLFDYSCPLESKWHSKFLITTDYEIYMETFCDVNDSKIDRDTIYLKGC